MCIMFIFPECSLIKTTCLSAASTHQLKCKVFWK